MPTNGTGIKITLWNALKYGGIAATLLLAGSAAYWTLNAKTEEVARCVGRMESAGFETRDGTDLKIDAAIKPIDVKMDAIEKSQTVMQSDIKEILRIMPR